MMSESKSPNIQVSQETLLNPAQLRAETARRLWQVIKSRPSQPLDIALQPSLTSPVQQAWMSAALYGCLRYYPRYKKQLQRMLKKAFKPKDGELFALLVLGVHQLTKMQVKDHAAINETVNACQVLNKVWAQKLVNAILRSYQRNLDKIEHKTEVEKFAHPQWMLKIFKKDWPDAWELAGQTLIDEQEYEQTFNVLDACAAPGGKTGHLLERLSAQSTLTAIDISAVRVKLVEETLARLGYAERENLHLITADILNLSSWYQNKPFNRILLDAPCTASGVIRRHPDIKIRRSQQQLEHVVQIQAQLLKCLWTLLEPGGRLLYATCSVFDNENNSQIKQFQDTQSDVKVIPLNIAGAINTAHGAQILPGRELGDGFFYSLLEKIPNSD